MGSGFLAQCSAHAHLSTSESVNDKKSTRLCTLLLLLTCFQCDNIKFHTINDILSEHPIDDIVPDSLWQPVDREQQELYESCLREPIFFR